MKNRKTQLLLATGATLAATVAFAPVQAADNPFSMARLDSGYQLAQVDKNAEGKCGASKAAEKTKEASCGAEKAAKKKEAACGANKTTDTSMDTDKKKDGTCGAKK